MQLLQTSEQKKEWLFWLLISSCLVLKIYQGDHSYYEVLFGSELKQYNLELFNWYKWTYHFVSTFVLMGVLPLAILKFSLNRKLSDFGIGLGDWKFGLKATLISFVVVILPVYLSSKNPEHLAFYPLTDLATTSVTAFVLWCLCYLPHYIGWELFFRGIIGFETQKRYGLIPGIMIPTLLTTLMHIGKPQGETWGALVGGIYFSFLTFRTRSILWPILFHWWLGILNSYFCG